MNGLLATLLVPPLMAIAPSKGPSLPVLRSGLMPIYPANARVAGISGTVLVRVSTDGQKVLKVEVISGPPMLAKAVVGLVESWQFWDHKACQFTSAFIFVLTPVTCETRDDSDQGEMILNLPAKAQITRQRSIECDPVIDKSK